MSDNVEMVADAGDGGGRGGRRMDNDRSGRNGRGGGRKSVESRETVGTKSREDRWRCPNPDCKSWAKGDVCTECDTSRKCAKDLVLMLADRHDAKLGLSGRGGWDRRDHVGGWDRRDHDSGWDKRNHDGGWDRRDHDGGWEQREYNGGWYRRDHGGGWDRRDHNGGGDRRDHDGGGDRRDHNGGWDRRDHDGGGDRRDHGGGWNRRHYDGGWDRQGRGGRQNQPRSTSSTDPIINKFDGSRGKPGYRQDKMEVVIKMSWDITKESKRIISTLDRIKKGSDLGGVLKEAENRLTALKKLWRNLALELRGEDHFQFLRNYSVGLQEWIEALSFYHYLCYGKLITWEEVQKELTFIYVRSKQSRKSSIGALNYGADDPVKVLEAAGKQHKAAVKEPEVTVKEPEDTGKQHEAAVKEPEAAGKQHEVAIKEPEVTGKEHEAVVKGPRTAAKKPEAASKDPEDIKATEVAGKEPEAATKKPETAVEEPDAAVEEPEVAVLQVNAKKLEIDPMEPKPADIPDKETTEEMKIMVPQTDFVLGMTDLTGDLMRKAIDSLGRGDVEDCFVLLELLKVMHSGFHGLQHEAPNQAGKKVTVKQIGSKCLES